MRSTRRLRALLIRLWHTCVRPRIDHDLADELEAHIQMHADDNVRAGMPPDVARREAIMKLGGVQQTRERVHDRHALPFLEHVSHDLRDAFRFFRRQFK